MIKIMVAYEHNPTDFATISLAVTPLGASPGPDSWKPAYRDTVDGRRVVWARFEADGTVWLRDRDGERQVRPLGT